jgi:hypothetical protein
VRIIVAVAFGGRLMSKVGWLPAATAAGILSAGLAGCAMIETYPTYLANGSPSIQTGGSYFLAKHVLTVTVVGPASAPSVNVGIKASPDRRQLLDTGMRLSPLSDDDITVEIGNDGLLTKITSIANDRTGDIIQAVVKAVYSPLLRAAADETPPPTLFEGEFDPFDWQHASEINHLLMAKFRSCIEVEIEPGVWSPGCGRYSLSSTSRKAENVPVVDELTAPVQGIYYRRPILHRVHIVAGGRTRSLTSQLFANTSPILRLDIDRTLFVKRETTIVFSQGSPTSVHVVKPSEGLAIAQLPLTVATAAIDAPIEGLTKRQALVTAETNYLDAQAGQIDAQTKLQSSLNRQVQQTGTVVGADPVSGGQRLAPAGGLRVVPSVGDIPSDFRARCVQDRLSDVECLRQYRLTLQ